MRSNTLVHCHKQVVFFKDAQTSDSSPYSLFKFYYIRDTSDGSLYCLFIIFEITVPIENEEYLEEKELTMT